jgi:hypothetical protein
MARVVTLHEYVVTYYGPSTIPYTQAHWALPIIVWKDILTNEITRHDGPCIIRLFDNFSILHFHAKFAKNVNEYINYDVDPVDCNNQRILSYKYHLDLEHMWQDASAPITHQYIVSYKEETMLSSKKLRYVIWKDILTGNIHRHDGPAIYPTPDTELPLPKQWFIQDYFECSAQSPYGYESLL